MNKSLITGDANITFTTEELRRNRHYNVTINAINVESSATTIISTHGIENTTITTTNGNIGISINTHYFRNSSAIGALFILIFISGDQVMNLSYRSFNRDEPRERVPLVPYLVLACDIESDGALYDGDGVSFPASVNYINISNHGIGLGKSCQNECVYHIIAKAVCGGGGLCRVPPPERNPGVYSWDSYMIWEEQASGCIMVEHSNNGKILWVELLRLPCL